YQVILVEKFESGELYRFAENVGVIRVFLQCRGTPSVHIDYQLHLRSELNLLVISHHPLCKAMYHERLGGQIVCAYQFGKVGGSKINGVRSEMTDAFSRRQVIFHGNLRVDTEVHMWHP